MKVIYIAGPFRGQTPWEVELNIRNAEHAALAVAELGGVPLCPHTMFRFFNGLLNDEFWLEGTKELLRRCDSIYLITQWTSSSGSHGEKALAEEMGMPIFYTLPEVKLWLTI